MSLAPNARIERLPGPVETTVGQEVVLMSLVQGECFGLGETGSEVWRLLAAPTSLDAIVATLSVTYDAPADVIRTDVEELLEQMLKLKLIRTAE